MIDYGTLAISSKLLAISSKLLAISLKWCATICDKRVAILAPKTNPQQALKNQATKAH